MKDEVIGFLVVDLMPGPFRARINPEESDTSSKLHVERTASFRDIGTGTSTHYET